MPGCATEFSIMSICLWEAHPGSDVEQSLPGLAAPSGTFPHTLPEVTPGIANLWAMQVCGLKHRDPHVPQPAAPDRDAEQIDTPQQDKETETHVQRAAKALPFF